MLSNVPNLLYFHYEFSELFQKEAPINTVMIAAANKFTHTGNDLDQSKRHRGFTVTLRIKNH